ncbi:MAG: type IV secretory system conjugative DNA transfer family protein [Bacteroidota bacterium]
MKLNFGLRFSLICVASFLAAMGVLYILGASTFQMDVMSGSVRSSVLFSAFLSIVFGYYYGFKMILKTRASVISYLAYLGLAWFIGSLMVIQWVELMHHTDFLMNVSFDGLFWLLIMPLMVAFVPPFWVYQWQKFKESPTYRQWYEEEQGGSARWASVGTFSKLKGRLRQTVFTHWFNPKGMTSDGIFLGRALFKDDPFRRYVVEKQDCHNITMGLTGSGKSVSVQNLTYSMYAGSIIGFDPKGELSRMTANRRHHCNISGAGKTKKHLPNGQVYVADPFGWNAKYGFEKFRYNPLLEIKEDLSNARQIASTISDALFTPEDMANKHFEENPKNIFEGFIIHVVSTYPKESHTLPFVYDLLSGINPETGRLDLDFQKDVLLAMSKNEACGGSPIVSAKLLIDPGPNERGSLQSTMSRHLKWLGDENMRDFFQHSNFRFENFGIRKTKVDGKEVDLIETLCIVLPDDKIKENMRFVRLILGMGIRQMQLRSEEEKPKIPTLVIIDEFPRLGGKVEVISEGFGILRSYGIKLWCFIQTFGQLKADYPKTYTSMLGNSTVQAFGAGMGDNETAEFVSKTLGSRIIRRYEKRKGAFGFWKKVIVSETPRELMTPAEVPIKLGKSAKYEIIFPNDGFPMLLERLAHKRIGNMKTLGLGGLRNYLED